MNAARLAKRRTGGIVCGMNGESDATALRALQEDIYRRRVLRARTMTSTERLDEVLELSNGLFGPPDEPGDSDREAYWCEMERRLRLAPRVREHQLYRPVPIAP